VKRLAIGIWRGPRYLALVGFLFYAALPLAFLGCGNPTTASTPAPPSTPAAIDQKIASDLAYAASMIQGLEPLVAQHPDIKAPLNQAIGIYTTARAAGLAYHTAVVNGTNGDPTQLQAQVQQVITSLTGLKSLYGAKP